MENKFIPLGDRVLVKSTDSEKKTKSGLVLTESARRGQKVVGEVVAVGLGIFSQAGERIPMTVKVGDKIMYAKDMAGDEIKIGDEKFLLFNEHQLLGIFNFHFVIILLLFKDVSSKEYPLLLFFSHSFMIR